MKHKIIALILALCAALGILPARACAAGTVEGKVAVRVVWGSDHGRVALSETTAAAGETVLLTADPQDGYLAEVIAVGTEAIPEVPQYQGLDTYAITMPRGDLTLEVSFAPASGKHNPVRTAVNNSQWGTVTASRTEAKAGEAVRIDVTPAPGCTLERIRVEDGRGKEAKGYYLGESGGTIRYEAVMPGSELSIQAFFARESQSIEYRATVTVDTGLGGSAWLDTGTAIPGEVVALVCRPASGYRVAQVTGAEGLKDVGDNTWIFAMPSADVELHVLFLRKDNPFLDINETQYCYDSVLWALKRGITEGIDEQHFGPQRPISRAAVVTMLWRCAGCPEPDAGALSFRDVPAGSWFEKAVRWAVQRGITTGLSADTFGPNESCNRAQAVTFLWRYSGCSEVKNGKLPFSDVETGSWYAQAVQWALEKGITTGLTADAFGPNESCQRAQLVTFLHRAQK